MPVAAMILAARASVVAVFAWRKASKAQIALNAAEQRAASALRNRAMASAAMSAMATENGLSDPGMNSALAIWPRRPVSIQALSHALAAHSDVSRISEEDDHLRRLAISPDGEHIVTAAIEVLFKSGTVRRATRSGAS